MSESIRSLTKNEQMSEWLGKPMSEFPALSLRLSTLAPKATDFSLSTLSKSKSKVTDYSLRTLAPV